MDTATPSPIFRSLVYQEHRSPFRQVIREYEAGELDLDAPYQRGHVWGPRRRVELLRSLTMGMPVSGIWLNDRGIMHPRVVIDGKQRITTVTMWLSGEIAVPADWFPAEVLLDPHADTVTYSGLSKPGQLGWANSALVTVYTTRFTGADHLDRERDVFDLVNFGGVSQGEVDDDR